MKTVLTAALLIASFSVSAQLLECHLRDGKEGIKPEVAGTLVLAGKRADFISPEAQTMKFDLIGATDTRTGSWLRYQSLLAEDTVATLSVAASGKTRRTSISVEKEDGIIVSSLSMKCLE